MPRLRVHITPALVLAVMLGAAACSSPDDTSGDLHLELVQAPTTGAAGSRLSPIIIRVVDADDQPRSGVPVTWAVAAGGGSIRPAADTSGVDGLAAAEWTLGFAAGENRLAISIFDQVALPVAVLGDAFHADQVTVTYGRACGVSDGDLWCWSTNYGDRQLLRRLPQFQVAQAALSGSHVCALDRAGTTRCQSPWSGQPDRFESIAGLPPLASVSAGERYFCGISSGDATPWCWDSPDFFPSPPMTAYQVSASLHLRSISAGGEQGRFACGIAEDDSAWCWGNGFSGQLGNGTFESSSAPVPVSGGLRFRQLAAGGSFACGVLVSNDLYCWGSAQYGLGNSESSVPTKVAGLAGASVSASGDGAGVLSAGGNAELWGVAYNWPRYSLRSEPQFQAIPLMAVAAGTFPCVIASDRTVSCMYSDGEDTPFYWAPVLPPPSTEVVPPT
jgi:hypothetical protein